MFTYEFIQDRNYTLIFSIHFHCSIDGELQVIPSVLISTKKSQKILYI